MHSPALFSSNGQECAHVNGIKMAREMPRACALPRIPDANRTVVRDGHCHAPTGHQFDVANDSLVPPHTTDLAAGFFTPRRPQVPQARRSIDRGGDNNACRIRRHTHDRVGVRRKVEELFAGQNVPHPGCPVRRRRYQKRPEAQKRQGSHWPGMTDQLDATDAVDCMPHAHRAVETTGGNVLVGWVKNCCSDAEFVPLLRDSVL